MARASIICGRRNSTCPHEVRQLWTREYNVSGFSLTPASMAVFAVELHDATSVRLGEVRPNRPTMAAWSVRDTVGTHKVTHPPSQVRWPHMLCPFCLPLGSVWCQGLAAAPQEAVHSLPAAESQEQLWLSLGGETAFLRESGTFCRKIMQMWHGECSREDSAQVWMHTAVVKNWDSITPQILPPMWRCTETLSPFNKRLTSTVNLWEVCKATVGHSEQHLHPQQKLGPISQDRSHPSPRKGMGEDKHEILGLYSKVVQQMMLNP